MKTHCKNGHPRITGNVIQGDCRICRNKRKRDRRPPITHCRNGHLRSAEVWNGKRCLICKRSAEKRTKLKMRYGMTEAQRDAQLASQDNKCAACRKQFGEHCRPETDHDHETEQVRGQLCPSCNKALSHVKDDIEVLLSLVEYLRKYQNKSAATAAL